MTHNRIRKVVILGGGTAGWMTAALLSKVVSGGLEIELVESEQIGTVGVGEATIPQIRYLCDALRIPEADFLAEVNGTYKLGIEFVNWARAGDRYIHTFGDVGRRLGVLDFHHVWVRARELGIAADLGDYSFNALAAHANRFAPVEKLGETGLLGIGYAFHFDATRVAGLLRRIAEKQGARRTEGRVEQVELNPETGFIEALRLDGDRRVSGDLFIDCSGFRSVLLGDALGVDYVDWSHWLPADSAIAVQCEGVEPLLPYTRATAHSAGWQWRIPLQNRIGNGHVYSSPYMSDDEAQKILLSNLDGRVVTEPRQLRFTTGKRKSFWHKNCVGLGLASGFMEPLESTSIHLVQAGLGRLIDLFPTRDFHQVDIDVYNQRTHFEFDSIRDFLILHYHATERDDSPFWDYCRTMEIPDSLQHKLDLWRSQGRFFRNDDELFTIPSWVQVLIGQRVLPSDCHGVAKLLGKPDVEDYLSRINGFLNKAVEQMPTHREFIDRSCRMREAG
jgi:tryptophan 7-halogenase